MLRITYATSTTATGSTPGDFTGRIKQVTADVNTQTGIVLAEYRYDDKGRLVTATDSRTELATSYSWTGADDQPRLASITPPGQDTFTFEYADNKLSKVTRPIPESAGGGTAQLAAFVDNINLSDIAGLGDVALAYYDTDSVQAITQDDQTLSWTLDGAGRRNVRSTRVDGANVTTLWNHYSDTGDNPTWSVDKRDGVETTTRWADLVGDDLSLSITNSGTAELSLADPHGSVEATITMPDTDNATGLDRWNQYDEYGNTTSEITGNATGTTSQGYGWLGTKQRSTTTTGLQLMGARIYNPVTGLFASLDPLYGGNDTSYSYPNDPINNNDTSGREQQPWWAVTARNALTSTVCASFGALNCGLITLVTTAVNYADGQYAKRGKYGRLGNSNHLNNEKREAARRFEWNALTYLMVGKVAA